MSVYPSFLSVAHKTWVELVWGHGSLGYKKMDRQRLAVVLISYKPLTLTLTHLFILVTTIDKRTRSLEDHPLSRSLQVLCGSMVFQ